MRQGMRDRVIGWPAGILLAVALVASPLAVADEVDTKQLDQRLKRLENIVDSGQIADLIQRMDSLEQELRELRGELEAQGHRMDQLRKRQRNLYADLDRRIREIEVAGTPASGNGGDAADGDGTTSGQDAAGETDGGAGGTGEDADGGEAAESADEAAGSAQDNGNETRKAYDAAFDLLKQGRYEKAAESFAQFVDQHPDSPYADNAQYWLGESRYVTRKFEAALKAFRQVTQAYPGSAKVPDARLKIGYSLYELGRLEEARSALQGVTDKHANSAVSRLAEERLLKIKREAEQGQ